MMLAESFLKVTLLLYLSLSVNSSPEALQRLYDTPHSGDHDHPTHDHHEHNLHEGDHAHPELSTLTGSESISEFNANGPFSVTPEFDLSRHDLNDISSDKFDANLAGRGSSTTGRGKSVQQIVEDAQAFRNLNEDRTHDFVFSSQSGQVALDGSLKDGDVPTLELARGLNQPNYEDLTITVEQTRDVYTTFTNIFYNSIPVTLTQFVKSTTVVPTLQVAGTPVDDKVLISTAPVTRTDTVFVTDTNTAYQYVTEVSTDIYTITHRAYDIQQQVVSSTLVQTELVRPTIVSTVIFTEVETNTVRQTITNTVIVEPRSSSVTRFPTTRSPISIESTDVENKDPLKKRVELKSPYGVPNAGEILEENHSLLVERHNILLLEAAKRSLTNLVDRLRRELIHINRSRGYSLNSRISFQQQVADVQVATYDLLNEPEPFSNPLRILVGKRFKPGETH